MALSKPHSFPSLSPHPNKPFLKLKRTAFFLFNVSGRGKQGGKACAKDKKAGSHPSRAHPSGSLTSAPRSGSLRMPCGTRQTMVPGHRGPSVLSDLAGHTHQCAGEATLLTQQGQPADTTFLTCSVLQTLAGGPVALSPEGQLGPCVPGAGVSRRELFGGWVVSSCHPPHLWPLCKLACGALRV